MIRITRADAHGVELDAFANGARVYLDNWAIIYLAKRDPIRRKRFVEALCAKGDLLFSITNVAELVGPKGQSAESVKSFLNELGAHWVPVTLNPFDIMAVERIGADPNRSFISKGLLLSYVENRMATYPRSEIIDLSETFFRLGPILDWVADSEQILNNSKKFDALMKTVREYHDRYEQNSGRLDLRFRVFNPLQRASFTCANLMRTLIEESKAHPAKTGDGMDFCHAVVGSAFAHFAALDKPWKRRVESLPKPNAVARIYSEPELDQMVTDIESWAHLDEQVLFKAIP
jgi:hypothetical protein